MTVSVPTQALDIRSLPPTTGDGNRWIKYRCFLYCRRLDVWVLWIGPAKTAVGHAQMFACEPCIDELTYKADEQIRHRTVPDT